MEYRLIFTNSTKFGLVLLTLIGLAGCAGVSGGANPNPTLLERQRAPINGEPSSQNPMADAAYDLMVAEIALNQGQIALAVEHYLRVARAQRNPAIAERAVRVAVYGQDLGAALVAAQRWIELEPDRVEARQVIAAIYIRQDEIQQAFDYIDDLIRGSELADEELFPPLLGVLAREKNADTVLAVSKRLADAHPGRAYAQYLHATLASQNGRAEDALRYFDRTLALADIDGVHSARARALLKLGRSAEAVDSLQKAVEEKPDDQSLRLTYARLLVDVKNYEEARAEFEKLHRASPDDADLLYTLGLLSLESQRFDDAEKYMLRLVEMDQRQGEAQYYLGRIYENRRLYDEAIEWYEQVHAGEYSFDARLRVAELLGVLERTGEAVELLDAMLKGSQSTGSLVRIYITKGELMRSARRYPEAMDVFNTALDIVPGNSDLLYARALVAEKLGRIDLLEADIRTILKTEPDNAHALNALGFTLADQTDRYEEAYGYLERAIEIMPDDAAIIDSWGWVHYRLGRYDEAVRLLRKALSRLDDAEIAAHLGEVLWVTGQRDEAREVWQRALQKAPDDPMLLKVMQRFIP